MSRENAIFVRYFNDSDEYRTRKREQTAGRIFRIEYPGPRRTRSGAQAPRDVYRRHRRAGSAPLGLRGRGQLDRRGAGGLLHRHRRNDQRGQLHHRQGQRPRHPDRLPRKGGQIRARSRAHGAARRRQVRQGQLQGLGRSARRGRLVRERPLDAADRRGAPRRQDLPPDLQQGQAHLGGRGRRHLLGPRHDDHLQARCRDIHPYDRIQLRYAGAASARAGLSEQGHPPEHLRPAQGRGGPYP